MNQRRIQPLGMGLRLSPLCGPDDHGADPDLTINFVVEMKHAPDHWRGTFAFYTSAIRTSRDPFGTAAPPAVGGLSLWRYPLPSPTELN